MNHRDPTVLDHDELATLRRAAAIAHTIGTIGLRLSAGGATIADVVPPTGAPLDRGLTPGPRVDPCGFRIAVANAWADHRAGRKVGLVGWDGPDGNELGERLTVTWAVGAPGKLLGLGAVRAMCATQAVWAFASLLPPDTLGAVLADVGTGEAAPSTPLGDELAAKLICDDLLDVTVVHIEADPAVPPTRTIVRTLDEVLRRMLAAVGAAEVVDAVAAQL
jgi:hypothetical protein